MPFDGNPQREPDALTSDFYMEMLVRFRNGERWTQGEFESPDGERACLLGMATHIYTSRNGTPCILSCDDIERFYERLAQGLGFGGRNEVADWNDRLTTTWADVEARLKEAMKNAL